MTTTPTHRCTHRTHRAGALSLTVLLAACGSSASTPASAT